MSISVVNMIPLSCSDETYQDSEPNIAVNPANPLLIAASAFTKDPNPQAKWAPIYISKDGGNTWSLNSIVPHADGITGDITLRFSSTNHLYVGYLAYGGVTLPSLAVAVTRTGNMNFTSKMQLISHVLTGDQPYIQAATVSTGPDAGKDRVYVGFSDGWAQMHQSLDGATSHPTFTTIKIGARGLQDGIGYDLPAVRTAVHPTGVVYAAFYSQHIGGTSVDVAVVRDDHWGTGASPFTDLKDSADGKPGQRVVANTVFNWHSGFGQERAGGELSIAVDPTDSSLVYVAWADDQPTIHTLHVRRSTNSGQSWPDNDLWTIPMAQNPALAVNSSGVVGFSFQQLTGTGPEARWETHFLYNAGGPPFEDLVLATVPADTPVNTGKTYLGDYIHLMAVGDDFYGVFSANNRPDPDNFPSKVTYQRNHDFSAKKLLAHDGVTEVPISIDPFFFKVTEIGKRAALVKDAYEVAIDPLALLLPSNVYQKLIEKFDPHVPLVAEIRDAVRGLSADERAFVLARARKVSERAKAIEGVLAREQYGPP